MVVYSLEGRPPCKCCKRPYDSLVLGYISDMWTFAMVIRPEIGVRELDSWLTYITRQLYEGGQIVDQNRNHIQSSVLLDLVLNRQGNLDFEGPPPEGYSDWNVFHRAHGSAPGPNGLLRRKIERSIVDYGSGPWDYVMPTALGEHYQEIITDV